MEFNTLLYMQTSLPPKGHLPSTSVPTLIKACKRDCRHRSVIHLGDMSPTRRQFCSASINSITTWLVLTWGTDKRKVLAHCPPYFKVMEFNTLLYMQTSLPPKGHLPSTSVPTLIKACKRDCRHRSVIHLGDMSPTRRQFCSATSMVAILTLNQCLVKAESKAEENQEDDEGVIAKIKSLFDPNEKTKSGKVLPKAYLKSAREVLKTLRESLREDPKDIAKFRRTADAAKESIRDYLNNWRGKQDVAQEESYMELEKVIRTLANFYAKAGPSATMSDEVKSQILQDLDTAEQFL